MNLYAALMIAVTMMIGGYFGAALTNRLSSPSLPLAFGVFVLCLGCYLIFGALMRLGRI